MRRWDADAQQPHRSGYVHAAVPRLPNTGGKRMKRITRRALALGSIAAPMAALSLDFASRARAAGTEINYWFWKDNPDDHTIADLAVSFEKQTGIHVKLMSDVTYNDFFNFLVNSVAAGTAPDATHLS